MARSTRPRWLRLLTMVSVMTIAACSSGLDQTTAERSVGTPATAAADDGDEITSGTFPPAARSGRSSGDVDATAANAALPAGAELEFTVDNFDLAPEFEAGKYSASLIVPIGWESRSFMGVEFEPDAEADLGFFTKLNIRPGCDGLCEVTDWEERLTGPDGYLSMLEEGGAVVARREVTGSAGTVRIVEDSFGTTVLVLRWDDSADRYFQCEAVLDEGAAHLAPAFEAACSAARPDWFPVG